MAFIKCQYTDDYLLTYCIEIDFKIYIGGRIWQIKDNTITLIYGKKRCCNGGRQGKRNEIDFEIGAKTPAADRYA